MRIVYLHQYFVRPDMSGGTRSFEMARRWVAAGHEVDLITSDRAGAGDGGWRVEDVEGIRVHWVSVPYSNRMSYGARIAAFVRFSLLAGQRAVEIGGDLVFATSTPLTIAIPGVRAARKLGVPLVFEVRDLWPEVPIALGALRGRAVQRAARALERWAYRGSARVVTLSPGMAEGVARAGYPRERIHVVPNASDVSLFSRAPAAPLLERHPYLAEGPVVTYAGTLGLVNGVSYMVDLAAAMLDRNPSVRFLIVGDGREEEVVRRRAIERGVLERNLWMLPPVPKRELPGVLAASTVATSFVIDVEALHHNSANKFFDALAAERPIAINYEGWQADIVRESGCGIVLPPTDAEEGAKRLDAFLSDPQRVRTAGVRAGELARTRFDRDLLAAELLHVLEDAVKGG